MVREKGDFTSHRSFCEQSSKKMSLVSLCLFHCVFVLSRAQGSITSALFSEVSFFDKYFNQTDPSVCYFFVDISHNSTFLKAKPNATFRLAAHLPLSNIISKVSINRFGVRESIVHLMALSPILHLKVGQELAHFQFFWQSIVVYFSEYMSNLSTFRALYVSCAMNLSPV